MGSVSKKLMMTTVAGGGPLAIEDVFSTYLYTGNGSTQTITNGIDLAGEGGLVWSKKRSAADNHVLLDTDRGLFSRLFSNTTNAEVTSTKQLDSFNSDGFTISSTGTAINESGQTYASWTFRKAPRFFDVVTYTGTGGAANIAHNLGTTVGSLILKRTDAAQNWYVYHRGVDFGATQFPLLALNLTNGAFWNKELINSTEPTDAVFSVARDLNISGATYVAYLFAHDPLGPSGDGSDGLIACGGYTGNGSTTGPKINLGWEPQWVMVKNASATGNWTIQDNMRGFIAERTTGGGLVNQLFPNLSDAEDVNGSFALLQNGFQPTGSLPVINASGDTYIYIAIRRGPMRQPTSGTEVFQTYIPLSTDANPTYISGFPVDMAIGDFQYNDFANKPVTSRLQGTGLMTSNSINQESPQALYQWDYMNGWRDSNRTTPHIAWMWRRAPGFFDVVAYTGTGTERQVPHGLGVTPEMLIIKRRDGTNEWFVHHTGLTSWAKVLQLQSAGAETNGDTGGNLPTETGFPVNSSANVNGSGATYIAYLFATLPGVSKVGSYTGNGTSQTIDCGFTSGARFILIKRSDASGDWYVWDTARGIVTGNDSHLSLNTNAAEVTTDDSIDPASSGFIVNQVAATNINVNAASYIFYAVA